MQAELPDAAIWQPLLKLLLKVMVLPTVLLELLHEAQSSARVLQQYSKELVVQFKGSWDRFCPGLTACAAAQVAKSRRQQQDMHHSMHKAA